MSLAAVRTAVSPHGSSNGSSTTADSNRGNSAAAGRAVCRDIGRGPSVNPVLPDVPPAAVSRARATHLGALRLQLGDLLHNLLLLAQDEAAVRDLVLQLFHLSVQLLLTLAVKAAQVLLNGLNLCHVPVAEVPQLLQAVELLLVLRLRAILQRAAHNQLAADLAQLLLRGGILACWKGRSMWVDQLHNRPRRMFNRYVYAKITALRTLLAAILAFIPLSFATCSWNCAESFLTRSSL